MFLLFGCVVLFFFLLVLDMLNAPDPLRLSLRSVCVCVCVGECAGRGLWKNWVMPNQGERQLYQCLFLTDDYLNNDLA